MHHLKLRRPSPALAIACLALFASLGGTGYAASRLNGHTARTSKHAKPLTKRAVGKLIAAYFKAHKHALAGATGPRGATGATGAPGARGPAGPGVIPVVATYDSTTSGAHDIALFGGWTVGLACNTSGANGIVTIFGPGSYTHSTTLGTSGGPPVSTSVDFGPTNSGGVVLLVNTGEQVADSGFLKVGSTVYQLELQLTATNAGGIETCNLLGDAIRVA